MPNFKIINNKNEITLDNKWIPATKFNSKDRFVDEKGHPISADYKGRQYRIIEKRERTFSRLERFGRGFLGVVAVVCTLCFALFSKSVKNLFTKSKENIRFAVLEKETQFKVGNGKVIYLAPPLLFEAVKISKDHVLNFALITTIGKQNLVPVIYKQGEREYTTYEGPALEALLKIAQNKPNPALPRNWHPRSPIKHLLEHPNNSIITKEEFLKFISEKDEAEIPRICTLNYASTLEVLNIIKEKKFPIDLNEETPTGKTLFTLWAGQGYADMTKVMLELDPSVIKQMQGQIESAFVQAAFISKEEAHLLIDAMEKKGVILSPEEVWIQRALKNDCLFSEEEFRELDPDLKIKIFAAAHVFGNEDIIKKLKPLGMDTKPLFERGLHILAYNMDIITIRSQIEAFLKGLKRDGLLLTTEEFSQLDESKYIIKGNQIGRILGRNFIEQLVKEYDLKHIKVPKKIAVIDEGLESISFQVADTLEPKAGQLTIYAERIESVNRKLSLEEAIEFMIILEKTGYNDFTGDNFFFAENGIYFIDTEYHNFSPREPQFETIKIIIERAIDPQYTEQFLKTYEERKEAYDKEKEVRENQEREYDAALNQPYRSLILACLKHEFAFPLTSLAN